MDAQNKDRQFVTALARGLEILKAFSQGEALLSNGELVKKTGLPKATISRLTHTLSELGYLVPLKRLGKYQLGVPALSLGYAVLANTSVRTLAKPLMQNLADDAQAPVSLAGRDGIEMVYLECCRSDAPLTLNLDVGSRIPLAATAMGRAYLAGLCDDERAPVMAQLKKCSGKDWAETEKQIFQAIDEVAKNGYCLSVGDWHDGINAVGAPLRPADGSQPLALNCGGSDRTLTRDKLVSEIGPRLVGLAKQLRA